MTEQTLADLEDELNKAIESYKLTETHYRQISSDKTEAINRLNAAQSAFDDKIRMMRKSAPSASDWAYSLSSKKGLST